jgi:DNA-binding NarL/FixJ family response regulator
MTTLAGSNPCAATASRHFCQYRWTSLAVLAARLRYGQGVDVRDLEGPEFDLVQELIEGFSAAEIARLWNLSERAVGARIRVVFAKLGVSNVRQLRQKEEAEAPTRGSAPSSRGTGTHGSRRTTGTSTAG